MGLDFDKDLSFVQDIRWDVTYHGIGNGPKRGGQFWRHAYVNQAIEKEAANAHDVVEQPGKHARKNVNGNGIAAVDHTKFCKSVITQNVDQ